MPSLLLTKRASTMTNISATATAEEDVHPTTALSNTAEQLTTAEAICSTN